MRETGTFNQLNFNDDQTLQQSHSNSRSVIRSMKTGELDFKELSANAAKASVSRIEFLEKELHLRTEGELMLSQTEQENENQLLRGGPEGSEEETSILERLQAESDGCKAKTVAVYVSLGIIVGSFFVAEHLIYSRHTAVILDSISHLQLGYGSVNSLKLMKLFALETYIDNATFLNYPAPGVTLETIYSELYRMQR